MSEPSPIKLSDKRFVTKNTFRNKDYIDIREFYQKDGEWKHGAKGVSMTKEQYDTFMSAANEIDAILEKL